MDKLDRLLTLLDKHAVVATFVLIFICYITGMSVSAMLDMAQVEPSSLERAAVIAAVLTPISGLMAGAITFYNKRKEAEDK
jgi:hypothetical protein